MRLTKEQQKIIKDTVNQYFGSDTQVILFGSRTDDQLKGGDIDLLLELNTAVEEPLKKNIYLNAALQMALGGPQKIDIIIHKKSDPPTGVYKSALKDGIRL